ncbi:hypothetical protein HMPREF1150_1862 [Streptococcus sp. AS14]|jgi:hypothetical protein|uniref:Uncharacterized protein n=1 Tax=Streptococcus sanguinis SK49 TaxID=888808 RepID=F3UWJ3_STRSA|nr:hypothetical protein HMPREF9380_0881 [Streptococcus sanguinis SK49]EJO18725.1 hypothetical protein HMPREF1150_1862 [Streptococcus sp. AS14]
MFLKNTAWKGEESKAYPDACRMQSGSSISFKRTNYICRIKGEFK